MFKVEIEKSQHANETMNITSPCNILWTKSVK